MISYHSKYFQVLINLSQIPIEASPTREMGWGRRDCSVDLFLFPYVHYSFLIVSWLCLLISCSK